MESQLHLLAGYYGVKTSYIDMDGATVRASNESLLAVLKALGAPLAKKSDVSIAIREARKQFWQQTLDPVLVVLEKSILTVNLHLPIKLVGSTLSATLTLENGEEKDLVWQAEESSIIDATTVERMRYVTLRLYIPEKLPPGYHRLQIDLPGRSVEALIISSPLKVYQPASQDDKLWGIFLPLYALHTRHSWGAGDFSDLANLMDWVSGLGGKMLGTLPLLPSFFDKKIGPGPYMPASKLFWNEFYLDLEQVPEMQSCRDAQALVHSPDYLKHIASLRTTNCVDYQQQLRLKRQVLELLSDYFFQHPSSRFSEFQNYVNSQERLEDYARFRAAGESSGIDWQDWPRSMRHGQLKNINFSEEIKQYYLYTQWLANQQMNRLFQKARQDNIRLYLDLPVGVHPSSYDVWRERDSFVKGITGGAPPDPVFTSGQNWNFPPLHPRQIRYQSYRYFIDSLRHQLVPGGILRIDHMMSFHRLFWIPEGMDCHQGVYVNYPADELYAILALESSRSRCIIVGEDLGIVPPEVRPAMEKHGLFRMYVGQFELIAENQMGKIPSQSVACLNTHDMFPFHSFWEETDIAERLKLKLIDAAHAQKELEQRRNIKRSILSLLQYKGLDNEISNDTQATIKAIYSLLAASPAYGFLINLEDLWLETVPQNVPGSCRSLNWSHKAHYSFEEFSQLPQVLDLLNHINRLRKGTS